MVAKTFSPDPPTLDVGAGTAVQQTARPRMFADHTNGGWKPAPVAATGATAGTPGSFTPAGSTVPANLAAMTGLTATPAVAWTGTTWVTTADAANVHWSGTAWVAGKSPALAARGKGRGED